MEFPRPGKKAIDAFQSVVPDVKNAANAMTATLVIVSIVAISALIISVVALNKAR